GGTILMAGTPQNGAGSLSIGSINDDPQSQQRGTGSFQLDAAAGELLVNSTAYLTDDTNNNQQALHVESKGTFGGPGVVNVSGQAGFDSGSTFAVVLNGPPSSGQSTLLEPDPQGSGFAAQIGTNQDVHLALSLGPDYAPVQGEKFVIISNSNGNINNGTI